MAKQPHEDRDDALKAWLIAHDLVGEFASAGQSAATFRMMWHRRYVPGFDPPVPDWFQEHQGETQGEDALGVLGFTPAEIAVEKAKPKKGGP